MQATQDAPVRRVAFIGLGNMGGPMAANLVKAGFAVTGFDLSAAACARLRDAGGAIAASAAEAARDADGVVTMLPASRHVERAYLGDAQTPGLLAQLRPGTLLIDCSTIAPQTARAVAARAAQAGMAMLDAPVSGGTAGAAAGTLSLMVGGAAQDLARARPVLAAMGRNIFHAGDNGAGQAAKMCNNMMLGIQMLGACEALRLGQANGLDPALLSDIMKQSSGRNWVLEVYNPVPGVADGVPASRGYAGGFGVDLMLKDLGLAAENALEKDEATPLGMLARNLFALHSAAGHGALDFSSVYTMGLRPSGSAD